MRHLHVEAQRPVIEVVELARVEKRRGYFRLSRVENCIAKGVIGQRRALVLLAPRHICSGMPPNTLKPYDVTPLARNITNEIVRCLRQAR